VTTVAAPFEMTRRELVSDLLAEVRAVPIQTLTIAFADDQYPTTSFVDELVRQVLVENLATELTLVGPDQFTTDLAIAAAERYGVTARLFISSK
jgi:hypothetical protein